MVRVRDRLPFHEGFRILEWLIDPLPDDRQLVTFGVTEPFFTSVKVSLAAAFLLALPVILWQVWSFLAPAFEEHAQRIVAVFVAIATAPPCRRPRVRLLRHPAARLEFLTTYDENLYQIELRASYYITFVTFSLLAMALIFQLPIFVLALVRLGVVTSSTLRRNRRAGIALCVIAAALLPTVDPVSLFLETIPPSCSSCRSGPRCSSNAAGRRRAPCRRR